MVICALYMLIRDARYPHGGGRVEFRCWCSTPGVGDGVDEPLEVAKQHPTSELGYSRSRVQGLRDMIPITHLSASTTKLNRMGNLALKFHPLLLPEKCSQTTWCNL